MRFAAKIAVRYLTSNKLQSALLFFGVGIGVLVFVFMSALVNGLATYQIEQTVGNVPHVILEPAEQRPAVLNNDEATAKLAAVIVSNDRRAQIRGWQAIVAIVNQYPEVRATVPLISGNAILTRGQASAPVGVTGVAPEQLSTIASIRDNMIAGVADLDPDGLLIGARLAANLSVDVGQPIVVRSERGRERSMRIRGIFRLGIEALDERNVYMNFNSARALMELDNGVSRIELKLHNIYAAPDVATSLGAATGLKTASWIDRNRRIFDALQGQGSTGTMIKAFSIATIIIGVASALMLSIVRRRAEIGIMRSMGVSQRFVLGVFVLQGLVLGLMGSGLGAAAGYGFTTLLADFAKKPNGAPLFPLDPAQGNYLLGIILATTASALAAILPARAASRIDPLEAISQ